ncbi:hypothetical protein GUITHDRAFT_101755 [Guillardia theta CCMP2712]|uniref:G-patch domain-containing protein n=2 Tax=Guillardia theta TaxID=55529 RepID=L1JWK8_GUITC|nr:hypothetical protein GUITHDRAFT_101755 [Guillardia theta CCMP2712]EKX52590.1 hypothetical protein GUITHDRAFT_101755 [Guillardia theta CCMP2712]|mmetsp:Transcript_10123/g.33752  ORF Transcript_10123/g.33752 Transcript_10123/m.33752 type:complete len:182 (+) Transcript_10123:97-642(+)|eukprot:XP_005839570.1 hypothetical protein GUITHDRAFT_101755 [Guillardia theta CCMP2712]
MMMSSMEEPESSPDLDESAAACDPTERSSQSEADSEGEGIGAKLMKKCGWRPGETIGADGSKGLLSPLKSRVRLDRTCIGHSQSQSIDAERAGDFLNVKSNRVVRAGHDKPRTSRRKKGQGVHDMDIRHTSWVGNVHSPRCKYDPRHRMELRKLKAHEERCPANPNNRNTVGLKEKPLQVN